MSWLVARVALALAVIVAPGLALAEGGSLPWPGLVVLGIAFAAWSITLRRSR